MAQHQIPGPGSSPRSSACCHGSRTAPSGPPEMGKRPLLWGTGGPGDGDADSCPLCSPPTDRARTHTCARAHPCVHTTHSHTLTPRRASSCAHSRMLAHTVTTCTHITHTSTPSHASHALIHPRWHLAPLPCKMSPPHPEPTSPPHKHRPSPQVGPGASPGQAPRKPVIRILIPLKSSYRLCSFFCSYKTSYHRAR